MEYESSGAFITSVLELKLDVNTMFEWQRHSQSMEGVPAYQELLDFIDLRAQASETSLTHVKKPTRPDHKRPTSSFKPITSFAAQYASTQTCPYMFARNSNL